MAKGGHACMLLWSFEGVSLMTGQKSFQNVGWSDPCTTTVVNIKSNVLKKSNQKLSSCLVVSICQLHSYDLSCQS